MFTTFREFCSQVFQNRLNGQAFAVLQLDRPAWAPAGLINWVNNANLNGLYDFWDYKSCQQIWTRAFETIEINLNSTEKTSSGSRLIAASIRIPNIADRRDWK